MKKWNNPERTFLKINTMCPHLSWIWVSSGCTEVSQKWAEEQPVCQQTWSWAFMWHETIAFEHLFLLVTGIKNHCHRGCHSTWVPDLRYHGVTLLSEEGYSVHSEKQASITTWLPLDYPKYLQNYSQFFKILNIYFPLTVSVTYMWLKYTSVCSVPLRGIVSCCLFHTIKSAQASYYKCS